MIRPLSLPSSAVSSAWGSSFDLSGYAFTAAPEQTRSPRVVRVGVIQNAIVRPTTDPVIEQRDALFKRIGEMVDAAGECGVNVLCLQEAWSERERYFCLMKIWN